MTGALGAVAPTGHMDAVGDYAGPVASGVLYDILGIPDADRAKVWAWEKAILRARGVTQPPAVKFQGDTANAALQFYLQGLVHQCQRTGGGSGLLALLCQQIGLGLVAEDVYLSCADFVAAGHLSNTWLIASGILRLLQNPDQLRALRLAPEKINQAVIELLRYEPPFQLVGRYAANATQVGGHATTVSSWASARASTTASGPRSRAWWCPPRSWRSCSGCPGWRSTACRSGRRRTRPCGRSSTCRCASRPERPRPGQARGTARMAGSGIGSSPVRKSTSRGAAPQPPASASSAAVACWACTHHCAS